jgi:hypothetical protein
VVTSRGPVISVIVPFWNAAPFSGAVTDGVVGEPFVACELTISGKGSTDSSFEIAKRYPRPFQGPMHCLEHMGRRNRGVAASCSLGARRIARLDGAAIPFRTPS